MSWSVLTVLLENKNSLKSQTNRKNESVGLGWIHDDDRPLLLLHELQVLIGVDDILYDRRDSPIHWIGRRDDLVLHSRVLLQPTAEHRDVSSWLNNRTTGGQLDYKCLLVYGTKIYFNFIYNHRVILEYLQLNKLAPLSFNYTVDSLLK